MSDDGSDDGSDGGARRPAAIRSVDAAARWGTVHDDLWPRFPAGLDGDELDRLAAAAFWCNEPARSIEVHQEAYRRHRSDGQPERAARSTWHLFYEHWLVGEGAVARGWLERGRRLLAPIDPDESGVSAGWLAVARADVLQADAEPTAALEAATAARLAGERHHDPDLLAMALQAEGRMLMAVGRRDDGLRRLDEAMVSVVADELQPLFTGWVYCNVIATCHGVGDVRRANEWSTAALRWCDSLREGQLYPGLCRVYAAELAQLRGDWGAAEAQARQACADLAAYDRRYAGAAHYVVGELCRLQGRYEEADQAFVAANELGRVPQPGLALLQADGGRVDEALAALRSVAQGAAHRADGTLLPTLQVLTALLDVAELAADRPVVEATVATITEIAREAPTIELATAYAHSARGRAAASSIDVGGDRAGSEVERGSEAATELQQARVLFDAVGHPYEAARQRLHLARLADATADSMTARLEREAANAMLAELGAAPTPTTASVSKREAAPGVASAPEQPGTPSTAASADALTALAALTDREREVLALAAAGLTNKDIAARLHLSPHTVARHFGNIFAKLGVRSRTAASSLAVAAGLGPSAPTRPHGQD